MTELFVAFVGVCMRGFAIVFGFAISLSVYLLLFIVQIQVMVIFAMSIFYR